MEMSEEQRALQEKLKNMSPEELKEYQKKNCIFCHIVAGKVPSKKVFEDSKALGILDINPAAKGHVLLLPKEHYAIMPQMPEQEIAYLFMVAKAISNAMLKSMGCKGTNIFVANGAAAGQKAQHFMLHIIPRYDNDGVNQLNIPEYQVSENDMEKLAEQLRENARQMKELKSGVPRRKRSDKEAEKDGPDESKDNASSGSAAGKKEEKEENTVEKHGNYEKESEESVDEEKEEKEEKEEEFADEEKEDEESAEEEKEDEESADEEKEDEESADEEKEDEESADKEKEDEESADKEKEDEESADEEKEEKEGKEEESADEEKEDEESADEEKEDEDEKESEESHDEESDDETDKGSGNSGLDLDTIARFLTK